MGFCSLTTPAICENVKNTAPRSSVGTLKSEFYFSQNRSWLTARAICRRDATKKLRQHGRECLEPVLAIFVTSLNTLAGDNLNRNSMMRALLRDATPAGSQSHPNFARQEWTVVYTVPRMRVSSRLNPSSMQWYPKSAPCFLILAGQNWKNLVICYHSDTICWYQHANYRWLQRVSPDIGSGSTPPVMSWRSNQQCGTWSVWKLRTDYQSMGETNDPIKWRHVKSPRRKWLYRWYWSSCAPNQTMPPPLVISVMHRMEIAEERWGIPSKNRKSH